MSAMTPELLKAEPHEVALWRARLTVIERALDVVHTAFRAPEGEAGQEEWYFAFTNQEGDIAKSLYKEPKLILRGLENVLYRRDKSANVPFHGERVCSELAEKHTDSEGASFVTCVAEQQGMMRVGMLKEDAKGRLEAPLALRSLYALYAEEPSLHDMTADRDLLSFFVDVASAYTQVEAPGKNRIGSCVLEAVYPPDRPRKNLAMLESWWGANETLMSEVRFCPVNV